MEERPHEHPVPGHAREKADPRIWDLFLQLFDDGRLTDHAGNTASFRSAIVIMTSNLAGDMRGSEIGFAPSETGFSPAAIQKALEETFRPEFINRIDRVVTFQPLGREVMRRLLDKEIRDVLRRRGLRDRAWAMEWEESAIEFLIDSSFSPRFGARPLKRAVERYLLAPLAESIVAHRVPEGDQFLFVSAGADRLLVEFVDPHAPQTAATSSPPLDQTAAEADTETVAIEDIVRAGRGDVTELDALRAEYEHLRETVDAPPWQERKRNALAAMSEPDFWGSARRFTIMGLAEYMDRIEVGLDTAGSLLDRLTRGGHANGQLPAHLLRRLAQQLYLVGLAIDGIAAGLPRDAFVRISAAHDPGVDAAASDAFARRIALMYRHWADKRRMRLDVVDVRDAEPYTATLAISGFAAYPILAGEHGQHVLESPTDGKSFARVRVLVLVAPQPDEPPAGSGTLQRQADRALDAVDRQRTGVVRRYRDEPSPLVRDTARGWRTGRIDQVLEGDFDLIG